ncbi:winged helix-turn-helix domain-containing protein [Nocardioides taihuensis]|uniref:Winged helix-turn-helix domain-containing protein n=1 Tax=Nocardioides taihuensis TaxID=1835606 RepID=A0ABW0BML1_9ACTN
MPERTPRPVADPRILRAIAHPVRNRILGELSAAGPSRAADLAHDLDIPANQASFHLRQLAKYGLVEEAPDLARDRRDRVWRAVHEEGITVETSRMEEAAGGAAAVRVFHRTLSAWAHAVVDAAFSTAKIPDTQRTIADYRIKLTKTEAAELSAELDAVVQAWTDRTRGRDSSRRTYVLLSMLQPETALTLHPEDDGEE